MKSGENELIGPGDNDYGRVYGASKHNPPGQEELLRKSMESVVKVTTIAHKDTPEDTIAALIGEQKNLEAKVLQWYMKTKDEEYRDYMGITVTRICNDNQSNNDTK